MLHMNNKSEKAERDPNPMSITPTPVKQVSATVDIDNNTIVDPPPHLHNARDSLETRSNYSAGARLNAESALAMGVSAMSENADRPRPTPAGYRKSREISYDVTKRRMSLPVKGGASKSTFRSAGSKFNQRDTSHSSSKHSVSSKSSRSSRSKVIKKQGKQAPFPQKPLVQ